MCESLCGGMHVHTCECPKHMYMVACAFVCIIMYVNECMHICEHMSMCEYVSMYATVNEHI